MKGEYLKANAILFLALLGSGLTTALLSVYLAEKGISLANIGLIFAIGAIIAGLLRVPIGVITDQLGRKKFMLFGAFGYPIFAIGLIYANTVSHYIVLDIVLELFGAIFWTAYSAYFFNILTKGKEGLELGGRNITLYVTSAIAPFLAGIIATNFGFANLFIAGAAISASAIIVALTAKDHDYDNFLLYAKIKQEYENILKIKGLGWIAAMIFLVDFIFVFWAVFMPIYLQESGISLEAIGTILSINIFIGALLQIPLGKAIDKLPVKTIVIPGFLLFWFGGTMFFIFKNYFSYLINRVIIGIGSDMAYWPAVGMLAKLTPKAEQGGAIALIFGLSTAIKGIGSIIGGSLTQIYGIPIVLIAVSMLSLVATIFFIPSKLLRKKGTQFHKMHHIRAVHTRHHK
ncbi:MAG: MFS transporter [Candidatus Nanoarchaeia archaeon]